jgi:hypothetical protein
LRPASLKAWIPGSSPGMTARVLEPSDEKSAGSPLPPCGGELERGVQRRTGTSKAPAPPSLALPHKEGGEPVPHLFNDPGSSLHFVRDDERA